uniref:G-protein coupled receptors family 1 profile domain-containing protein n=2 Tax=Parascaris univalens TaxID=6257 RepID=A0A915B9P9_PARUN
MATPVKEMNSAIQLCTDKRMANPSMETEVDTEMTARELSYVIEVAIYAFAMILGCGAFIYTAKRLFSNYRRHLIIAARLMSFKISLTIADLIVLFVYAPTQIIWISTYYWYGGDVLCRTTKFLNTFSLHLTANMQVLIAADRLYITSHLRKIHQESRYTAYQMISVAWMLAIACAIPQLLVFHVSTYTPNGEPQCVSIWTIVRYYRHIGGEISLHEGKEANSTDVLGASIGPKRMSADYYEWINDDHNTFEIFEHAYNILHLLSIYIVPYSIELFCYTAILILMKSIHMEARRESCSGGKTQRSMTMTVASYYGDNASTAESIDIYAKNDSREPVANKYKNRALSLIPVPIRECHALKIPQRLFGSLPSANFRRHWIGGFRHSVAAGSARSSLLIATHANSELDLSKQRFATALQDGEMKSAWQMTMSVARRRTRLKAFLMLTLNMIFWTPYCVLGIVSTLTVFDHSAYDFVNAFVVLNAVSNLLL